MKVFNRAIKLGGQSLKIGATIVRVLELDNAGKVLRASGTSVPTGAGYAKSCLFIKTDAATGVKGLYENQGTTSSASFNLVGDISSTEISFADGEFVKDDSGLELLVFGVVATAVNEIKISNAATGDGPIIAAQGGDTDVDLNLVAKGTGTIKIAPTTYTENQKGLYVDITPTDLTHGTRQGAIAITMSRSAAYAMTGTDGNPDTALKITLSQRSASGAYGRSRAMDVTTDLRDSASESQFIEGMQMTAKSRSGTTLVDLTVARFLIDNGGAASGDIVGVQIQDNSQSATGTTYGFLLNSAAYAIDREYGIYIDSLAGSWVNAISFDGAITNVLDFAESDGTNGATLKAGAYSTSGNEVKLAIDVAGTTYYLIGYATAS